MRNEWYETPATRVAVISKLTEWLEEARKRAKSSPDACNALIQRLNKSNLNTINAVAKEMISLGIMSSAGWDQLRLGPFTPKTNPRKRGSTGRLRERK